MRLLLLLLVVLLGYASAATITGRALVTIETTNLTDGSTSAFDATQLSMRATHVDHTINVAIGTRYYVGDCLPPTYPFTTTAKGVIPSKVLIYRIRTCQVDATADVNQTTSVFVPSGVSYHLMAQWHGMNSPNTIRRGLLSSGQADAWSCAFTNNDCDKSKPDLTTLTTQMAGQILFADGQRTWNSNVTALLSIQAGLNTEVDKTLAAHNESLNLLAKQLGSINESVGALAAKEDERASNITRDMVYLYNNTARLLGDLQQGLDDKIIAVRNACVNDSQRIIAITQKIVDNAVIYQKKNNERIRSTLAYIRQLHELIRKGASGNNQLIDEEQLPQIWNALDDAVSRGYVPVIDPLLPGLDRQSSISEDDLIAPLDRHTISFVNSTLISGGTITLHQFGIDFICNIGAINRLGQINAGWQDVTTLLGPPNCTLGYSSSDSPVTSCSCWVEISHFSCPRKGSTFNWETMNDITGASYLLQSSMCLSDAQPTPDPIWNGRRIDTLSKLNAFLGTLANSRAIVGGTGFRPYSWRFRQNNPITPNYASEIINVDVEHIFETGNLQTMTLPYYLYADWVLALGPIVTQRNEYWTKYYGIRPRGLTNEFKPFTVLNNEKAYSCYDTYITATTPETEVVYAVHPEGDNPRCTVNIYDQPPDCTSTPGVCIPYGSLLGTQTLGEITVIPPAAGVLPTAETLIVGELSPSGMLSVRDIPQSLLSTAPDARSKIGKVTYPLFPFADDYDITATSVNPTVGTLTDWEAAHPGNEFSHNSAADSSYWLQPFTDGVVVPRAGFQLNQIGTMLEAMQIDSSTDMRQGALTLVPREWEYLLTFQTVTGPLVIRQQSGCPDILFNPDDIQGRILTLTNGWPFDITLDVARTNSDPLCPAQGDLRVVVLQGLAERINVHACGNYSITVYSVSADVLQPRTACGAPLSAVLARTSQSNVVISQIVNATSLAVTAEFDTTLARSSLSMLQLILGILLQPSSVQFFNITPTDLDGTGDTDLARRIADLALHANGIDYNKPGESATDAIAPFIARFNALDIALAASLAAGAEAGANVHALTLAANAAFDSLNASTIRQAKVIADFITVTEAAMAAIRAGQQAQYECNARPWSLDRIMCIFYQALGTAVTIFVFAILAYLLWLLFKRCQAVKTPPPVVAGRVGDSYGVDPEVQLSAREMRAVNNAMEKSNLMSRQWHPVT